MFSRCYAETIPRPCPSPKIGGGDLTENESEAALLRRFTLIFGINFRGKQHVSQINIIY